MISNPMSFFQHPDPSVTISDIQGTMLAFNFFPAIKADSSPSTHALSMDLNSTGITRNY